MKLAPIALFVYNRPAHTRQTVEALQKNELAGESDLFIFSDAAKRPETADAVREVREYVKRISGFKSVSFVERDMNWGLANSIIDGVTRLCNEYGRVIVLEDDLLTSPYFLRFMNEALDRYQEDARVMQISGHMFPTDIAAETDAVFLPMTTSWGWATWQRAWQQFDSAARGYETIKRDAKLRHHFNLDGTYNYFGMLEQQLQGMIDSWAVRWHLSVFMQGGLALFPRKTLVGNTGFDGTGTHCEADSLAGLLPKGFRVNNYPDVAINEDAKQAVYDYLARQGGQINRVRRSVLKWLRCKV